jgi:kumamolisin
MLNTPPFDRLRLTSPLFALLAFAGGCSDDSAGTVTETATTGGINPTSSTSDGPTVATQFDPTETEDPTHPDSSVTHTSTGEVIPTTGDVTATTIEDTTMSVDPSTTTTTATTTTGDESTTETCDDGPLCEIPPEEMVPTEKPDGLPSPLPGVYDDQGEAPLANEVRGLIGFPTRSFGTLEDRVADMYDPSSPDFGQYMSVADWMKDHAPTQADYDLIKEWLEFRNLPVTFDSSNRMVVAFKGSVADFNDTFKTTLHICLRKNPQQGNPPFEVYCTIDSFTLPKFVAERTTGLLTADLPTDKGSLPPEGGAVISDPPGPGAFDPPEIAAAYEVDEMYQAGFTGQGVKLGVVAAATFHAKDLQTFWKSFGITRALPKRVQMMEPVITRITETILDTQWSSSIAPGAEVITYEGPDARNTALLFVFNEAIARGEVQVLTDSFAHREDSEPLPLRHQYNHSALMGAALGITVISASGDSARPDIPCTSPYVVCVGGTDLITDGNGTVISETAWDESGSGDAKTFNIPDWQVGVAPGPRRATVDVALNAGFAGGGYWIRRFGNWESFGGTSFSAPVFAGLIAVINSRRLADGEPTVGLLTPVIYTDPLVRATFRDVTIGATDMFAAKKGWDYPTGWGAPRAKKLADALP